MQSQTTAMKDTLRHELDPLGLLSGPPHLLFGPHFPQPENKGIDLDQTSQICFAEPWGFREKLQKFYKLVVHILTQFNYL